MSQRFVEGIGLLTIDDKLSEQEIQANINYRRSITPKYPERTFSSGFSDTQSMIYRWWKKLNDEENERGRWLEDNVKEWGQHIGYYDSIALESYYSDVSQTRELTKTESADREANREMIAEFKADMYHVYENNGGDTTEVQKKYGYTPEDIGVIDSLVSMMKGGKYTLGAFAGMIIKDPELLLISFLKIPQTVARGSQLARATITAGTKIKPPYVRRLEQLIGNKRAVAMAGRGAEGAVYGSVYEGLHDLTFKGKIDPKHVRRGAAIGSLMGTAFGAITKSSSNSWFVDRTGSNKALNKWEKTDKTGWDVPYVNKKWKKPDTLPPEKPIPESYRPTPDEAILPDGLTHEGRFNFWKNDALENIKKTSKIFLTPKALARHEKMIDKRIENTTNKILKQKNPDGSRLFTPEEARGLAARKEAEVISGQRNRSQWQERYDNSRVNPNRDRRWGEHEERVKGRENKEAPDYTEPPTKPSDFEKILPEIDISSKAGKPTTGKIVKAGVIGGVAGAWFADEDEALGALIGAASFGLARGTILKGINVEIAKMKQAGHKIADKGKLLEEHMQKEATMVGKQIQKILKVPEQYKTFLTHVENYSKKGEKERIIETHGKEYYEAVQSFHNTMETFWKMANELNIFKDESHVRDYVTHIFGKELSVKEMKQIRRAINEMGADGKFNFSRQRTIFKTIEEISKDRNIVFDPVRILIGYTQSLQKIMAGRHIVNHLNKSGYRIGDKVIGLAVDVANKVDSKIALENGYKASEIPALKGKLLHPLIKRAIEDYYAPDIGTRGFAGKAAILNNAMKRVVLSASLFHAQALLLSGVYAGAFTHMFTKQGRQTMKEVREALNAQWDLNTVKYDAKGNPVSVRNLDGKLEELQGNFVRQALLREIVDARLGIGTAKTNELVNAGYRTVKDFLDRRMKPLGKAQDMIDRITWDGIHDHTKLFVYLTMKQRLMAGKKSGIGFKHEGLPELEARSMAAQYANDAFGGQNFNKLSLQWEQLAIENANNPKGVLYQYLSLAATPTRRGLLNWLMLSPDWTISNINIAFKGLGFSKNVASKILARKKLSAKEAAEWNMYMGYMARAAVSTSMLAYIMHSLLTEDEEFDLQDFWLTGRVDLGNGEELVVSKQIAEPMHWIRNPFHEGLNKGAALPKAALEVLFGKQWLSLKHGGTLTGPKFDRDEPMDWVKWFSGKATPITINPYRQAIFDEYPAGHKMFQKSISGFLGFPRYGRPEKKRINIY
jgi:hypothetical protein